MSDSNHHSTTEANTASSDQFVKEMRQEEEPTMLEFSEDEEDLVARMFRLVGKRWSLIAGRIPGRTAQEIEKYWSSKCAFPSDQCSSSA
ncbi:hypothetical protein HN51_064978 [Arachis hypogaea]|uniref:Uncharacterized protein n=2 Tax=Arachis TaxID=3817 RepID=A0A444ZCN5_ARAHY|nr:MYB-like transcription factor ETC3 [Arachis duranensis]XP_016196430.1 MYB-like transcription factor ETC3 [Arachis ipaensis]XP_025645884.1 MYB-like transcription factor ETC3 [Arachis hypogaea]XP_025693909.1 MYB-like transcription factor ETC3 [Arachis hypogaea]QHO06032.1 MYB-like transcription factor [Arachis hypogaea]QHO37327.1 MYB-like transcription factor [Arachis hypogaea]RYR11941.1 hypothetical protein Ahy_B04g069442 [Arachis hypogaea]